MRDARDDTRALKLRALRRRVLLGTLALLALFFGLWRAWELEARLFFELLAGSVLLIGGTAALGAGVAWVIGWLRSRRR